MDVSRAEEDAHERPAPADTELDSSRATEPIVAGLTKTTIIALVFALVAAWAASAVGDQLRRIENIEHGVKYRGTRLSVETATRNSATAYALLGAGLSLSLGLTASVLLGPFSVPRALTAAVTGIVAGGSVGFASAYVLTPIYFAQMETADITLTVFLHLGIWAAIGAAAGIAFGIGSGGGHRLVGSIVGGIAGAALGSLLFDVCGAFVPFARTERPLSEEALTRLVSAVVLSLFTVVGIVVVAFQKPAAKAKRS